MAILRVELTSDEAGALLGAAASMQRLGLAGEEWGEALESARGKFVQAFRSAEVVPREVVDRGCEGGERDDPIVRAEP